MHQEVEKLERRENLLHMQYAELQYEKDSKLRVNDLEKLMGDAEAYNELQLAATESCVHISKLFTFVGVTI